MSQHGIPYSFFILQPRWTESILLVLDTFVCHTIVLRLDTLLELIINPGKKVIQVRYVTHARIKEASSKMGQLENAKCFVTEAQYLKLCPCCNFLVDKNQSHELQSQVILRTFSTNPVYSDAG